MRFVRWEKGRIELAPNKRNTLFISVDDSGPGVIPAKRAHFSALYYNPTAGQGTGLGLSIAKQVVEQHGGTISVSRSERLGGAKFLVQIPVAKEERIP